LKSSQIFSAYTNVVYLGVVQLQLTNLGQLLHRDKLIIN